MLRLSLIIAAAVMAAATLSPRAALAGSQANHAGQPVAYLDGQPIPLADVSKYYCDDFSYPTISCSSSSLVSEARATTMTLFTSVDYVTIYDLAYFAGSYMHVSQDYAVLGLLGWNDRISSFKARNSETGRFWTDWFNGGISWSFCCNWQVSSLGAYDNTFSSVQRT